MRSQRHLEKHLRCPTPSLTLAWVQAGFNLFFGDQQRWEPADWACLAGSLTSLSIRGITAPLGAHLHAICQLQSLRSLLLEQFQTESVTPLEAITSDTLEDISLSGFKLAAFDITCSVLDTAVFKRCQFLGGVGLGGCAQLRVLAIERSTLENHAEWLSAELATVKDHLEQLTLADCELVAVPESVPGLHRLNFLSLQGNAISELPERLPSSLGWLYLKANRLADMPLTALEGLTRLECLALSEQDVDFQISRSLLPVLMLPSLSELCLGAQSSGLWRRCTSLARLCSTSAPLRRIGYISIML